MHRISEKFQTKTREVFMKLVIIRQKRQSRDRRRMLQILELLGNDEQNPPRETDCKCLNFFNEFQIKIVQ